MTPHVPIDGGDGDTNRLIAAALMSSVALPVRRMFVAAASTLLDREDHLVASAESDARKNLDSIAASGTASHELLVQLADALLHVRRERRSIATLRETLAAVAAEIDRHDRVPMDAKRGAS
ncbi:MAG: hypothetical protein ACHREM_06660 [Polyangiales bacterium]